MICRSTTYLRCIFIVVVLCSARLAEFVDGMACKYTTWCTRPAPTMVMLAPCSRCALGMVSHKVGPTGVQMRR